MDKYSAERIHPDHRQDKRQTVACPGQFYIDADVFDSSSVDLSEGGARLLLNKPVKIVLRLNMGTYEMERNAQLVWARKSRSGDMEYGLQFLDD